MIFGGILEGAWYNFGGCGEVLGDLFLLDGFHCCFFPCSVVLLCFGGISGRSAHPMFWIRNT